MVQLPSYAPELNPVEGVWANMKNGLGNLAACTADQLAATVRSRLKRIQYRPALIDGFLAQTGSPSAPDRREGQALAFPRCNGQPGRTRCPVTAGSAVSR